jgi:hypothetical protein
MPHSSKYDGYQFWISKKLVWAGKHKYEVAVSVNDTMKFSLKRVSPKTYKMLDEKIVTTKDLIETFGEFTEKLVDKYDADDFREVTIEHIPEKMPIEKVVIDETLVR